MHPLSSPTLPALACTVKIVQFSGLLPLLPRGTPASDVARVLQQTARLVRGLWVVRSDVLYPKGSKAPLTGVSGELLARARDWMVSAGDVA